MAAPDQIQARSAAAKFIQANAGPDRMMAVVDFGGSLRIVQNFTANADVLRAAVSGVKSSSVDPNAPPPDVPVTVASVGLSSLSNAQADFGARSMLLAVRSLAKNLRSIPEESGARENTRSFKSSAGAEDVSPATHSARSISGDGHA